MKSKYVLCAQCCEKIKIDADKDSHYCTICSNCRTAIWVIYDGIFVADCVTHTEYKETILDKLTTDEILGPWEFKADGIPDWDVMEPSIVYNNHLYINVMEESYYLILEQHDFESQSLRELEIILADYSIDAGVTPYKFCTK